MNGIRLLIVALALTTWSCESLKNKGAKGKDGEKEKPMSFADIDTSDLPEEYTPNLRPVIAYYVDDIANSHIAFDDALGDYQVMLYHNNVYKFIATAKDKSKSESKGGVWKWHRIGPDQGFLILDDRRWFLNFTSLEDATATTKGDNRTFKLKFSHL